MTIEADGVPRWRTLPRLEIEPAGRGGSLTIRLGRGVHLGRGTILQVFTAADSRLDLAEGVTFAAGTRVWLQGGDLRLGTRVHAGDGCLLKAKAPLHVGARTLLTRQVSLHATAGIAIGEDCAIGERSTLIDSDHAVDGGPGAFLDRPLTTAPIRLGRNVSVSAQCVLLRGTVIGDNGLVAAGAVVAGGEHPAGVRLGGVPAKAL